MRDLALIALACYGFGFFMPGQSLRRKVDLRHDINWQGPHVYVGLVRMTLVLVILIWLVTGE